jgi:response regulator RpfG family c-di-GMP phosphodiesterase
VPLSTSTVVRPTNASQRGTKVLLVDDDASVVAGLRRQLFGRYSVHVANSGEQGLHALKTAGPFAVVVSDMRMPEMDGAMFLAQVREIAPDATRILLTGYTDVDAAIRAINEGQVFRFLTKPCSLDVLLSCLKQAVAQHRLVIAERELLDQTLRGAVGALFECLQMADPTAFDRAGRIRSLVIDLCKQLSVADSWPAEVAAVLSQLGSVTLPPDTARRLRGGARLTEDEQKMIASFPRIAEQIISGIPRLDPVREILRMHTVSWRSEPSMPVGAAILRVATHAEDREARRMSPLAVHAALCRESGQYSPEVLDAYHRIAAAGYAADVTPLTIDELEVGIVLADDVYATSGQLLIGRGTQLSETSLERLRNYARQVGVVEPVLVTIVQP